MASFYWNLDTESGENLSIIGRHIYGLPRDKAEPDDVYRTRIKNLVSGFTYHDEPIVLRPLVVTKAPKYPGECPCGIKASDCTYHADL